MDSTSNNSHSSTQAIEECINLEDEEEHHIETKLTEHRVPLTIESLAEQNELFERKKDLLSPRPNAIRAWAAELPEVPDSVKPILTSSHVFEMETPPLPVLTDDDDTLMNEKSNEPRIQETKDVFTETQKVAYVSLCYLTSLEVVHDLEGKDFAMARMSADNWQRKLMRMLYAHMDISAEEIKMIESLSKHQILAKDLVHQFTAQGETATVKMEDLQKQSDNHGDDIVIDLRWTVMCDLFLLCLSTENYDARSRVFVARVASYLSLDWFQVIGFEKRIAEHLIQDAAWETETVTSVATTMTTMTMTNVDAHGNIRNDTERRGRNKQRRKRRYVMIGLATIGGGLILGLSAGIMAPVIAGGLGAILTTVGVTGSAGFLGGTAGIALITGGATVAGGRKSMNKRMKSINTFEFLPVRVDENVNCIVSITGWLPSQEKDEASLPFSTLDALMGDHYALYWEPEMLEALGSAFRILATEAVTFSIQQALAHTIMGTLLAGLAFPLALTKLGYIVDNPWANALDRSRLAGLILADALMNRNLGARPITLVGYSLGARVIFFCLLELARVKAFGLVENVALFGTPVSGTKTEWKECTTVVSGRFINGYASNDWLLGFLFRTSTVGLGNIAGLRPLMHIEGNRVQNLDCTDLISGHLSYRTSMPKLLKRAGFMVTSEELPLPKEKDASKYSMMGFMRQSGSKTPSSEGSSEVESDLKNKHLESASTGLRKTNSLSSLSSGHASIQVNQRQNSIPSGLATSQVVDNDDDDDNIALADLNKQSGESTNFVSTFTPEAPETPRSSNENKKNEPMSDFDIIADILANATAAASSKNGTYSSLSSGKASIATPTISSSSSTVTTPGSTTRLSLFGSKSKSETTINTDLRQPRKSLLFGTNLFGSKKKPEEDPNKVELQEAGIEVKEIKSTLGRLVVPQEVANPMPEIKLECPQHAKLNR
ncbi:DUF726-domain-containing protein [Backusella circina FSU 941]|nr:DUF726-domain-containing protein [Backusella circina FSU 941]